jgi:stearoyl-CoA desaturase (delta-9 desaturase)
MLTHNQQVRSLQIINHIIGIIGIIYAVWFELYYYLIIALITYWIIGTLGINVGYHRLLSHRSFKTNVLVEKILAIIGVITTVGSPMAWAAVHRQHHLCCEREGDPHSPYILGNLKAWFGFWNLKSFKPKLINDFRKNVFYRNLHRYYLLIILFYCIVLYLIDPFLIVYSYCIPACLCLHSSSAIIVIAHRHGYRTYDLKKDQSRNSWIANLITLGEGWHNNHHAKPYAYSNWEKWWEWDIPSMIIRVIKHE